MFFKVDYEKVSETSNILTTKTEELNSLYLGIIDICREINENWQSKDSTVYLTEFNSFVNEKIEENNKLNNIGKTLKGVSSNYKEQDNRWAQNLINRDILKGKNDRYE